MMQESVVCHKKFEKNTYVNAYKRKTRTVQKFWFPGWIPELEGLTATVGTPPSSKARFLFHQFSWQKSPRKRVKTLMKTQQVTLFEGKKCYFIPTLPNCFAEMGHKTDHREPLQNVFIVYSKAAGIMISRFEKLNSKSPRNWGTLAALQAFQSECQDRYLYRYFKFLKSFSGCLFFQTKWRDPFFSDSPFWAPDVGQTKSHWILQVPAVGVILLPQCMLHPTARNEGFLEFPFWKQSFIYGACGQDGPLRLTIKPLLGACFSKCCKMETGAKRSLNKLSPFQPWRPKFSIETAGQKLYLHWRRLSPTFGWWSNLNAMGISNPKTTLLQRGVSKKLSCDLVTPKNSTELLYQGHSDCLYAPCAASGRVLWTGPPVPSLHVEEGGASVVPTSTGWEDTERVISVFSVKGQKLWAWQCLKPFKWKCGPRKERKSPTDPVVTL